MLTYYFGIREPEKLSNADWALKVKMLERIRKEEAESTNIKQLNWRWLNSTNT